MNPEDAIELFKNLLKIPTISAHAGEPYKAAATLLADSMRSIGLKVNIHEFVPGKPVVIGLLEASEGSPLSSIMLSGHYDVVPVTSDWAFEPFKAEVISDRIYGRGAQDMKSVLVQYIAGLSMALKMRSGRSFKRPIYLVFLPDEEIGGRDGAQALVDSAIFKSMNVGLILDEGLANESNTFSVFAGERAINYVRILFAGPTGHGSRFVRNTAVERASKVLSNIYEYRSIQEQECSCKKLGEVLTVNVTSIHTLMGQDGNAAFKEIMAAPHNVIPPFVEIVMDVRVPLHVKDLEGLIKKKFLSDVFEVSDVSDASDVKIEFIQRTEHPIEVKGMKEWLSFFQASLEHVIKNKVVSPSSIKDCHIQTEIFPAATDSRFFRKSGIPCIGFSPIRNTPILLHDVDEYLTVEGFIEGCTIYAELIDKLGDCTIGVEV